MENQYVGLFLILITLLFSFLILKTLQTENEDEYPNIIPSELNYIF